MGQGLPSVRTGSCRGGGAVPVPEPTPRPGTIGTPMAGPGAGSRARLAAAALSELRVKRRVLGEGGSGRPTYHPWLSSSLRYWNDTGIISSGSDTEAVANAFTHALR